MNIVEKLHDQFLEEAKKSPILLTDLANLEKYISESYSERSLIELIQNADDANASKFYVNILNSNTFIIANNGDSFTEEDVIALCRSGSSTKSRKSGTIGFRGIGFKSVVNFTNNVHLISGEVKLTFSKELTKKVIPEADNIPLIRIPHTFNKNVYDSEIEQIIKEGYNTIFIFEIKTDALLLEINSFEEDCMLFLRNIESVKFKTDKFIEFTSKREKLSDNKEIVNISSGYDESKWLVLSDYYNNENIALAFLFENNQIKPLNKKQAVIHSFMPTKNQFIIPCKINGDFSTDPSRTKIILDEETYDVINNFSHFFKKIICDIIKSGKDTYSLISVISSMNIDPLSQFKREDINTIFLNDLKDNFNKLVKENKFLIQPDWLSENSFFELYKNSDKLLISDKFESDIPGIRSLLKMLGFDEVSYKDTVNKASKEKFTEDTRVDIITKSIEKTRFTVDQEDKTLINEAYLFDTEKDVEKTKLIQDEKIPSDFVSKIENKVVDKEDYKWFAEKFNINYVAPKIIESNDESFSKSSENDSEEYVKFQHKNLNKWRSVEENVIKILNSREDVKEAKDVSLNNLGYDAEITLNNGIKLFYEIKSVSKLGDPISLTNNEYSNAHTYQNDYYLAIASQNNDFIEICFIQNPIEKLDLNKRVTKWEWICNSYEGKYSKIKY